MTRSHEAIVGGWRRQTEWEIAQCLRPIIPAEALSDLLRSMRTPARGSSNG